MKFSMIENVFDSYPEAIVHLVNCIGISHDPLSKKMKRIWPDYFREYARACIRKQLRPYHTYHYGIYALFGTKHILTMTIKNNWQEKLKQENMLPILESLLIHTKKQNIKQIAIPLIDGIPQSWIEEEIQKLSVKLTSQSLEQICFFKNA